MSSSRCKSRGSICKTGWCCGAGWREDKAAVCMWGDACWLLQSRRSFSICSCMQSIWSCAIVSRVVSIKLYSRSGQVRSVYGHALRASGRLYPRSRRGRRAGSQSSSPSLTRCATWTSRVGLVRSGWLSASAPRVGSDYNRRCVIGGSRCCMVTIMPTSSFARWWSGRWRWLRRRCPRRSGLP